MLSSAEEASRKRDEVKAYVELRETIISKKGDYRYTGQTLTTCDTFQAAPKIGNGDNYCTIELKDGVAHVGKHSWEG